MKVRIKKTGELVNIAPYCKIVLDQCDSWGTPIELSPDEVELIQERSDNIDWEQRRYEIAKEAFPFVSKLTTDIFKSGQKVEGSAGKTIMQVCAEKTLLYADALINELKKQEGNQ